VRAGLAPEWKDDQTYLICLSQSYLLKALAPGRILTVDREGKLGPVPLLSGEASSPSKLHGVRLQTIVGDIRKGK
jgi:hypothetical protein